MLNNPHDDGLIYYSDEQRRIIIAAAIMFIREDVNRTALAIGSGAALQDVDELYDSLKQEGAAVDIVDEAQEWLNSDEGRAYDPVVRLIRSEAGDWVEAYVNDTLKFAGHKIHGELMLDILGITCETREVDEDFPFAQMVDWHYPARAYPQEDVDKHDVNREEDVD